MPLALISRLNGQARFGPCNSLVQVLTLQEWAHEAF